MSADEGKVLKREDELRDISEIPEVQQGLYAPDKPSLVGKFKEGVSGLGSKISHQAGSLKENIHPHHEGSTTEHPKTLFGLINEGISGLASGISTTIHSVTGSHETEKPLGERSEHTSNLASSIVTHVGGIDTEVKLAQELESNPEEGPFRKVARKMSRALDDYKDDGDLTTETTITPNREGPSALDKINDQYGKVADKIAGTVDQIKDKVLPSGVGANTESNITDRGEDSDSTLTLNEQREPLTKLIEAPTHQINPAELKEFHDVKTGFHESVDEFKHEQRIEELGGKEELISNNPFEALGKEEETTDEDSRIFGDITNKTVENQPSTESKTLAQVVKEGISDVTATISATLGKTTDKAGSTFGGSSVDKENARQVV